MDVPTHPSTDPSPEGQLPEPEGFLQRQSVICSSQERPLTSETHGQPGPRGRTLPLWPTLTLFFQVRKVRLTHGKGLAQDVAVSWWQSQE